MSELRHANLKEAFLPLAEAAEREGLFDYSVNVATLNDRVVGFVAYSDDELAWLYVDPALTRRGIGTELIRYVLDKTAARPLSAEVLVGNLPALQLYRHMGFEITATKTGKMPGNESFAMMVHCMQKI